MLGSWKWLCILAIFWIQHLCALKRNDSTKRNNFLLELVNNELAQKKFELGGNDAPVVILRDEYKITFPKIPTESKLENDRRYRVKRDNSGVLKANEIQAEHIKTDKMIAKQVSADIVKANKVRAIVISIGKAFSMHKTGNKDVLDTLVLNRDGPDPTDSSVTIVLERDGHPVSINAHPSHEKEKAKLLEMKNSFVARKSRRKVAKRNFKQKTRKPARTDKNTKSINPKITSTKDDIADKKRLLMDLWRKKIQTFQKRRISNDLIVTTNPIFPTPSTLPLRSPSSAIRPVQKPARDAPQNLLTKPRVPFSEQNSLQPKEQIKKSTFQFGVFSDYDSAEWENDDDDDYKHTHQFFKTFKKIKPSFDDSSDEFSYDTEDMESDYFLDSSEDDDVFFNDGTQKKIQKDGRGNLPKRKKSEPHFYEYSYESDDSEYEFFSDESYEDDNRHRSFTREKTKSLDSKPNVIKDDINISINGSLQKSDTTKIKVKDSSKFFFDESEYSSEYEYYSDEMSDDIVDSHKDDIIDKSIAAGNAIPRKGDNSVHTENNGKTIVSKHSFFNSALSRARSRNRHDINYDYTESDESDSVISDESQDKNEGAGGSSSFFTDSAEKWFNSDGKEDSSREFDSFERKRPFFLRRVGPYSINRTGQSLPKRQGQSVPQRPGPSLSQRADQSLPKGVGQSLKRVGRFVPKRLGQTLPKRLGQTLPKRLGQTLPKRLGKTLPKRLGQPLPKRVGHFFPKGVGRSLPKRLSQTLPKIGRASFSYPKIIGRSFKIKENEENSLQKAKSQSLIKAGNQSSAKQDSQSKRKSQFYDKKT